MAEEDKGSALVRPLINNRSRERYDVPDSLSEERTQKNALHQDVEHLHGPQEMDYENDELLVLVVLRDGRPYVKSFIEHYHALGVKHLIFLDNGSTDGTVEALREYDSGVSVFRTTLPFKHYQISMRQYLVERFGQGRWTLSVDIDELFDYPYSDVVSLGELLGYLNRNDYTAVVAHMLDMFPEEISSSSAAITRDEPLKELHRYYELSEVRAYDYSLLEDAGNTVSNGDIQVLHGGVQKRLFRVAPLLTKHPLVFLEDGVRPFDLSEHWAGGVRVADFTGVLLHYKLSASLYGLVRREMEERTYPNKHGKYDRYLEVLEENSSLPVTSEATRELSSVNELVGSRFVTVSGEYMRFVEEGAVGNGSSYGERLFEAFLNAQREAREQIQRADILQQQIDGYAWEAEKARRDLAWSQEQARIAREQVQAIQSSRSWRAVQTLGRARQKGIELLGHFRKV